MPSRPDRGRRLRAASVIMVLTAAGPVLADLTGSTMDMNLVQVHPSFGYELTFAHVYGTTSTVSDPLYPTFPISVTTPAGVIGRDSSIVIDYSANQYGDFAGFTGALTVTNVAEEIDATSLVMVNEASQIIGTVSSGASSIVASWAVNSTATGGSTS